LGKKILEFHSPPPPQKKKELQFLEKKWTKTYIDLLMVRVMHIFQKIRISPAAALEPIGTQNQIPGNLWTVCMYNSTALVLWRRNV
jgi:hypothetical protein